MSKSNKILLFVWISVIFSLVVILIAEIFYNDPNSSFENQQKLNSANSSNITLKNLNTNHPNPPANVALCIVYDTSGSMSEKVLGISGREPKYMIANRALSGVLESLQNYADNGSYGTPQLVYTGLLTFNGFQIPMAPFDKGKFNTWLSNFNSPKGGTPLGIAIENAGNSLMKINSEHKHILVLTDGRNTSGENPSSVIPRIKSQSLNNGSLLDVHVIGFDVKDKIFEPLKALGVNVFSANDEKELIVQLDQLLKQKILLEIDDRPSSTTLTK